MDEKIKVLVQKPDDLVTTQEMTKAGFIALALEKNMLAIPFVSEAKALKALASQIDEATKLTWQTELRYGLIAASGLSEKAMSYLSEDDKDVAIQGLIKEYLEPAGSHFVEELVYRFLLTKGDNLGGKMRNVIGKLGQKKFLRMFVSILNLSGEKYHWKDIDSDSWIEKKEDHLHLENRINGLYWDNGVAQRLLIFNVKVPIIKKNVDLVLLKTTPQEFQNTKTIILNNPDSYLALGELKGGVDPAGADEHWKTANSALERIHSNFGKLDKNPLRFFIGSAIEKAMAIEIFNQLQKRELDYAANLTNDQQLAAICSWLYKI